MLEVKVRVTVMKRVLELSSSSGSRTALHMVSKGKKGRREESLPALRP